LKSEKSSIRDAVFDALPKRRELGPVVSPNSKKGKVQIVTRKKRTGRGNNPRIKTRDEIKRS
jgi:hypothetical protein